MTEQNDTIVLQENGEVETLGANTPHTWQPSVKQILSWLPADATPEQQDSAIQAHIKPSEIHWSNEPDTLHLPGQPVGRSLRDVSLPKYYRESYFEGRPWFHPDLFGGRLGVAGDPVPYNIARDNIITLLLVVCFVLAVLSFTHSRDFMVRQVKNFFRQPRGVLTEITETAGELRFQFFLVLQTSLLLGLVYFFYIQTCGIDTFIIDQYQVIAIFAAEVLGCIVVKAAAYAVAGWLFFDQRRNAVWMKSLLFISAVEGVALFPMVLLQAYFDTSVQTTCIYAILVLAVFKLLAFYKTFIIFFSANRAYLQNFLYFCTLEIIPVGALWGVLTITCNYLKVNF